MSNIFFTADNHFYHWNIIKHCNRPWSKEDHNDALIQRWNAIVNKKDLVYVLGDFAMISQKDAGGNGERMKAYRRLRHQLNGKIILIHGNHDKMNQETYNCFTEVHHLLDKRIDGKKVTLCHYPMRSWNCSFHGAWHFFGHVHGRLEKENTGLSCDVGVDVPAWNYTPVPWETLKEKMEKKQVTWEERIKATSRG